MLTLEDMRFVQGDFALSADWAVTVSGITAVIGPSGAGKSTLLAVIGGYLAPTQGRIVWGGADITGVPPGARPVAALFQDNNLFPHLTIDQNLGLALSPRLRLDAGDRVRIAGALDRVGLAGMGARKPGALSGGQQSRAVLARVLLQDKPLVLLDEPFAALGPGLRADMLDLVRDTLVGREVLMVTHAPEDAVSHADQVVLVADGCANPPEPARAFFANPPPAFRAYLGGE